MSAALRDRGAVVTGIDSSAGMLELARRRLGDDADLRVVDLRDPLPFDDDSFDDVVASLVLHYLEAWGPTLAGLRPVLRPGGQLIASVNHPFAVHVSQPPPRPSYFANTSCTDAWTFNGRSFTAAGFRLADSALTTEDPMIEVIPDQAAVGLRA
ncbi:methyltransferase domain-containing protein [Nonomuraea jiangxiensis]|uniref:methyltransferase domain-containing protein n=1 Tax=Nonomuraea jiangxiensis TaxID=633440 RepID=UPI000B32DFDF